MELTRKDAGLEKQGVVAEINERHREILHNTGSYLKVIGNLALQNECEKIYEIVEELNGKLEKSSLILYSNNIILNAILSQYATEPQKNNIIFDVYVEPVVKMDGINDSDIISIMGNLLDNAERAAGACGLGGKVSVRIFMQKQNSLCVIKIVNDYKGELIREGNQFCTTKKETGIHGVGIKSVNRVAEKYNGILEYHALGQQFFVNLILPVK